MFCPLETCIALAQIEKGKEVEQEEVPNMWHMNNWCYGGGFEQHKQGTRKLCAKVSLSIHYRESESKKNCINGAYETRDETTPAYADNGI